MKEQLERLEERIRDLSAFNNVYSLRDYLKKEKSDTYKFTIQAD